MTAVLPEVIIALIGAFLVITDWVLRMITGDKPRPRAEGAVRGRKGTAAIPAAAVPQQWANDPATLTRVRLALREDEVQP